LITIVGPGGIGKTRLALAVAAEQAEAFTHGAAFVPLQAISAAAFVAPAILSALDIPLQGQRDPREQLLDYLRGKEALLVLDNVEQLLAPDQSENDGIAGLLSDILEHPSGVTLLVTSRERLALEGEWLFDLAGLNYPPGEPLNGIEDYSAVRLFMQRAGQVRRQFSLADGEARAVARICRLVEGLPLAIELAAAALRARSCTAVAEAIETSMSTLATRLRAIPERHRSMWATFEHSWRLLSDEERQVFARLSVFHGGFQEDAAAQVAQASPQLLVALVDKSLLRWDGVARYDMHELVRQYAEKRLRSDSAADAAARRAQAAYFLMLVEQGESHLFDSAQRAWLGRLDAEHDNLRVVLAWSHMAGDVELESRLAGALGRFWYVRGYFSEGRQWLEQALADGGGPVIIRTKALNEAALLTWMHGDAARALALYEESLALSQQCGDKGGRAVALKRLAQVAIWQGDNAAARVRIEESIALLRAVGDTWNLATAIFVYGCVADLQGDETLARTCAEESMALFRAMDDHWSLAGPLGILGQLALRQGDYATAHSRYEESLELWRASEDKPGIAWGLHMVGMVALAHGDDTQAATCFAESLVLNHDLGDTEYGALCLMGLAAVAAARRQPAQAVRAARLFGAAERLYGPGPSRPYPEERIAYECQLTAARALLSETAFAAALAAGRAMTVEHAIAYALDGIDADSVACLRTASSTP
jgi:predicted ATPase